MQFHNKTLLIVLLLICSAMVGISMGVSASTLNQWGVTWTFHHTYNYGQFANGEYWVVADANDGSDPNFIIIHIDPCCSSTEGDGRIRNGAMLDPNAGETGIVDWNSKQGFESSLAGWVAGLNVALPGDVNITSNNPLVLTPPTSLVCSRSGESASSATQDFAILTILSSAPATDSFRPAYASQDKTISYNVSDINFETLSDLAEAGGSAPSWADVNDWIKYPNICIAGNNDGSKLNGVRSSIHDDYGEDLTEVLLKLNCNYTDNEKRAAAIYFCQQGIDIYGIITENAGGRKQFKGFGAFSLGKKMVCIATAKILDATAMLSDIGAKSGVYGETNARDGAWPTYSVPADYYWFNEDDDTFYLTAWDVLSAPYTLYSPGARTTTDGTVTVTNGSNMVTGSSTLFLDGKEGNFVIDGNTDCVATGGDHDYGAWFALPSDDQSLLRDGKPYEVAEFVSNTSIRLKTNYTGDTSSGEVYVISSRLYYGHGSSGVSNYPNCYRGQDFRELSPARIGWASWQDAYLESENSVIGFRDDVWVDGGYKENNGRTYGGQQIAMLIMGLKSDWNNNAFFDYVDWYIVAARKQELPIVGTDFSPNNGFGENMWDTYRTDYGALYSGPSSYIAGVHQ